MYNFTPTTYITPNEYRQFINHFGRGEEKQMWICKPTNMCRGMGITIINSMEDLKYEQQSVLQQYIDRPLLIRGLKWDMRLYVAIPSLRPFKLYLYQEGLVRFSTARYDNSKLNDQFSHLTNSSINKYAHGGTEGAYHDNKWTLEQLRSYC